jgi:hypothetical protein
MPFSTNIVGVMVISFQGQENIIMMFDDDDVRDW